MAVPHRAIAVAALLLGAGVLHASQLSSFDRGNSLAMLKMIQIEKRGTVIGDRSAGAVMTSLFFSHTLGQDFYGRGSIAFYGTSITVADFKMSDGFSLEKIGVTPDETLLPTGADLAVGRDPVLARAITLLGGTMTAEQAGTFYKQP